MRIFASQPRGQSHPFKLCSITHLIVNGNTDPSLTVRSLISSHLSTYILNAKWKTTPFLQTNDYGPALIIQLSCFIISACYVVPCHVRFGISNEWPKYPTTTTTQQFEKNSPFNVSSRLHTLAPSSSTSPRPQETQSASQPHKKGRHFWRCYSHSPAAAVAADGASFAVVLSVDGDVHGRSVGRQRLKMVDLTKGTRMGRTNGRKRRALLIFI